MRLDVLSLQRFYASPLGGAARTMAQRRLAAVWPDLNGLDVLGFGYASPYLDGLAAGARRMVAAMPGSQGAERWPADRACTTALVDETRLPFADAVFDRVVLAHALEESQAPAALLREIWRVMAPEGRLVVVAANRMGAWSLADSTAFGHGRPYSRAQLRALLRDALFEPLASTHCLYVPPLRQILPLAEGFERIGEAIWPAFGGLVMVEAIKRLSAGVGPGGLKVLVAAPARRGAAHREDTALQNDRT